MTTHTPTSPSRPPPSPTGATAATRARILTAAEASFLRRGFRTLTMAELAAELGMSKKTLYRHFPGKRELLGAMIGTRLRRIERDLSAIAQTGSGDVAARLNAALAYVSTRLGEIQTVFLQDIRRHAPEVFDQVIRFRRQTIPRELGRLLEEGRRQGLLRDDVAPELILEILLAPIQALMTPEVLLQRNWSPQQTFETILAVALEGLLTPAGRRRVRRHGARRRRTSHVRSAVSVPPAAATVLLS